MKCNTDDYKILTPTRLQLAIAHYSKRTFDSLRYTNHNIMHLVSEEHRPHVILSGRADVPFLASWGCRSALDYRNAGVDVLTLVTHNESYLVGLLERCPPSELKAAFLCSAEDAVVIAGTDACDQIGITLAELLGVCRGRATEARSVLDQVLERHYAYADHHCGSIRRATPLIDVPASLLLDAGVYLPSLRAFKPELLLDVDSCERLTHSERERLGVPTLRF